jgi:hypothetical protein
VRTFISIYASSNITSVIKSRRMKWVEYAACMGEVRNAYRILVRKHEHHSEDVGVDEEIILEWILGK